MSCNIGATESHAVCTIPLTIFGTADWSVPMNRRNTTVEAHKRRNAFLTPYIAHFLGGDRAALPGYWGSRAMKTALVHRHS